MPDVSIFNRDDFVDTNLQAAQFGIPVKSQLLSVLGMKPSAITTTMFIENDVLELDQKFKPLPSAHIGNLDEEGGAPTKKDGKLSDNGAKQRDNQSNDNRAK